MYGPRTIWCVAKIIFWRVMMTKAWHVVTFVTWVMASFQIENLNRNPVCMFNVIVLHRRKSYEKSIEKRNTEESVFHHTFSPKFSCVLLLAFSVVSISMELMIGLMVKASWETELEKTLNITKQIGFNFCWHNSCQDCSHQSSNHKIWYAFEPFLCNEYVDLRLQKLTRSMLLSHLMIENIEVAGIYGIWSKNEILRFKQPRLNSQLFNQNDFTFCQLD